MLSEKIKALAKKHSITYAQWSEMSGVPEGTIKSIASGSTERPSFESVCAMIKSLNESIDAFYSGDPASGSEEIKKDAAPNEQHHYHHFHVMSLRGDMRELAREAIASEHSTEIHRNVQNNLKWWRIIALCELAFIVFVLAWDITHPNMGYIQYASTLLPIVAGRSGELRMMEFFI